MSINVGLIGYGLGGKIFHAPLIAAVEGLTLHTIVSSRRDEILEDYPAVNVESDPAALWDNPAIDLVVVATPNTSHHPLAKAAILANKHVVMDKPFTITTADADELIALAHEHEVMLSVFQNRRWDNGFLTIKQLLKNDTLGRLYSYEAHFDRFRLEVQDRWREQDEPGAGMLYDLGAHLIDQALHLFGRPETIWADLGQQRPGAKTVDYFHLILGYGSLRVILHSGTVVQRPPFHFALHGEKGSFLKRNLDPQEDDLKAGLRPWDDGWGTEPESEYGELFTMSDGLTISGRVQSLPGAYEAYYAGVEQAIRQHTLPPVTAEEGRLVIAMIEAAMVSHEEQRVVKVS
ncbi:MAG: oxidoreductase [Anaerolineales bacterium]|nr:oxidoreductase [Anaerolineales bacterium]